MAVGSYISPLRVFVAVRLISSIPLLEHILLYVAWCVCCVWVPSGVLGSMPSVLHVSRTDTRFATPYARWTAEISM